MSNKINNINNLEIATASLKITNEAKEALKLSGIRTLKDFNVFDLNDFTRLFANYSDEVKDEVIDILKKYGLPENLNSLGFSQDVIGLLRSNNINNTYQFINSERALIYQIFKDHDEDLDEVNKVLNYFKISDITINDYDPKLEKIQGQQRVGDINLKDRVSKEIKRIRKSYGSRSYSHFKVRIASPDEIRMWSHGEVLNHETINYRTAKPEEGGLFCEKIFGPVKSYQCRCGKKQTGNKGQICPKCGIEITDALVRRERMGHIELESPVVHTWFLKNSPSRLATLLGIKSKLLEEVIYYAAYIVTDPGQGVPLKEKQILHETEYSYLKETYGDRFQALTGAEAIRQLLINLDLEEEAKYLRVKFKHATKQKRQKIIKRLEVVEAFNQSDNKPEWMVMDVIPVMPPDLRPMVALDGGRFATTDINDLYRRILNRNNRLKKQKEQQAARLIVKNEMRMLQEAVDALFDNAKRGQHAATSRSRILKSLSDSLRGKRGRFRQNLLGKRVDYSARSVIIVGPELKMYQAGIPREMAITLYKPFVLRELLKNADQERRNVNAKYDTMDDDVWQALETVVKEHPILLNRAPTLHRLGIQAFETKLIDGKAIRLHPLVTPPFNADFDGDQMAVHLPLSPEAIAESRILMLASNNILNPKDGKPVVTPSQDMVLGNYYLTIETKYDKENKETDKHKNEGMIFANLDEVTIAYENKLIDLHTRIFIRPSSLNSKFSEEQLNKYLLTTYGKLIFNNILPDDINYLNEPSDYNLHVKTPDKYFYTGSQDLIKQIKNTKPQDIPAPFNKKYLSKIIALVFERHEVSKTSIMLDKIKDLGFKYSTISGVTVALSDINVYSKKKQVISKAQKENEKINEYYEDGDLTQEEREALVKKQWEDTLAYIQTEIMQEIPNDNPLFMMYNSGARGSTSNFAQLLGMRGLMLNPKGETIEVPVLSSFREGLTVAEYFISTHGARKGSTDTALKTAESGYLTRRLVDVAQDIIIVTDDCGIDKGFLMKAIYDDSGVEKVSLYERIVGRYSSKDIINPNTNEIICRRNDLIDEKIAKIIIEAGIDSVEIRSTLKCNAQNGLCAKCYGRNLASNEAVEVGEAVGVIAAQSIGEPGTQLTMRTFHTGGVAGAADITQGLPRVQELFEARRPKGKAIISEQNGKVIKIDHDKTGASLITIRDEDKKDYRYRIDPGIELTVKKGDIVSMGDRLTYGSIHPKELLRVVSVDAVENYILEEVQKVYRSQGVEISDKHIEIIIRQMLKRVLIVTEGDTELLPDTEVSINEFKKANLKAFKEGKRPAVGRLILLGITRASLRSDSLLSAASFQETTRILTDGAIKGQKDELYGLKENVIIGGLIPAGTGILTEKNYDYKKDPDKTLTDFELTSFLSEFN